MREDLDHVPEGKKTLNAKVRSLSHQLNLVSDQRDALQRTVDGLKAAVDAANGESTRASG
jgi:outer membrane murein-binding lipoprotein Lpp